MTASAIDRCQLLSDPRSRGRLCQLGNCQSSIDDAPSPRGVDHPRRSTKISGFKRAQTMLVVVVGNQISILALRRRRSMGRFCGSVGPTDQRPCPCLKDQVKEKNDKELSIHEVC